MKISQILDKIDDNQLYIPAFQREYVWKRSHAKALMDSLINDYPTGTLLTWETNEPPELKGETKYKKEQGSVKLVLDGQQRITTLYMILRGEIPPYYTEKDIKQDTRNLYVNVETNELQYYKKLKMQNNPLWVNLTDIFLKNIRYKDVIKGLEKNEEVSRERDDLIYDNFNKIGNIVDRDFLEQSVPIRATIRDAIDIFYIVNASGVNLTEAELALAQISGYWPEARKLFKEKLFSLAENGFVFSLDFIMYVLLGVLHNMGSDMSKLHPSENKEKIKKAWKKLDEVVLDYVFNIMKSQAYVDHTKEINSVYALVPIIVYAFHHDGFMDDARIKKAVKWFYYSQIRNRYVSQLPQKLDKDISIVVNSEKPFEDLLSIIRAERPLEIQPEEFVGVGILHPLYSLMRWYFKSKNAICLTTGINIRKNMGKRYELEWDHIFPYSLLKENGYNMNNRHKYALAQEITNRAILTATANRSKSAMNPDVYLNDVKDRFPSALSLQSIPESTKLWKLENYEQFLVERRKILASELNEFLDNITEVIHTEVDFTIDELIRQGENSHLEFKSSLRWDYRQNTVNKKLEEVVLKTVAAFNNSNGGILLIGVDDDGELLGLDNDYQSQNGDKDKFELHLFNIIDAAFGTGYSAKNISASFPIISEKEICMVEIEKGDSQLFLKAKSAFGIKSEKFYVRRGNASVEIVHHSEVTEFIKNRFNNK